MILSSLAFSKRSKLKYQAEKEEDDDEGERKKITTQKKRKE